MCSITAALVLGTVTSAYGAYQQGKAAQRAAEYNAAIQRNNAIAAEYQAQDVAKRAESEKQNVRRHVSKLRGKGRVGYAAGNVALGVGSPLDWESDLAGAEELDLVTLEHNAALDQWALRNQASNYKSQATLLQTQGRSAANAGRIGAATSLLNGAYQYYKIKF